MKDIQTLKIDLIHWLTELHDETILMKLEGLKREQEENFELSISHKKELDERLNKYETGEMKFSSWSTVKERIRKRAKDAL
jgi:putative addiction module component (TIGR02574 family)